MFKTEISLVSAFKAGFTHILLRQINVGLFRRFVLIEEFDSCNGVADIVVAIFRPNVRLQKQRPPINSNWLSPLANLPHNKVISLKEYVAHYGISPHTARKQLESYVRASFIETLEKNTYRVTREYIPFINTTIAIEAKLRDWKKALQQAYRYKHFSNYSFVLLPAANAARALHNISMFQQYNIGLVTLGEQGLNIHYSPPRREFKPNDAFLRVNESAYQELIAA